MKHSTTTNRRTIRAWLFVLLLVGFGHPVWAADRYTAKQMEAFASRVGQTFWSQPVDGKGPSFAAAPAANAKLVRVDTVESFQIAALVGQANQALFYKIKRENGQEGYISPEQFLEALNLTIVTIDPAAEAKRKSAETAEADKKRIEWIRAQPWSPAVKEAAIKKQPVPGLTSGEVKRVLGPPSRVTKVQGPIKVAEEHWLYTDGSLLIFHNGLLIKVEHRDSK